MVDLRLFDILKVNFKGSITFSHPLSHCPPLMTRPLTANVVKGLAASLCEEIGMIPDLEQLIPAPHAPAGLSSLMSSTKPERSRRLHF